MKKSLIPIFAFLALTISCKKKSNPVVVASAYMSMTVNSTWNYEQINNISAVTSLFTLTSTNRDSTIGGKAYHVYTNSSGSANEYYNITGNDYYTFRFLGVNAGGATVENIYLKDNASVGASWSQNVPVTFSGVPLTITITNSIAEKGISKTVKGITYADVIHVTTTMAVAGLPPGALTTDIQSYYARKYGVIENKYKVQLNYSGVVQNTDQLTSLKTADIK